jgi:hypothetical protein
MLSDAAREERHFDPVTAALLALCFVCALGVIGGVGYMCQEMAAQKSSKM